MLGPRLTCAWKLSGTNTFRLASSALFKRGNSFKGFGTNLQNSSEEFLKFVEPDEGKIFVQPDCAGAEALIVAYLCPMGNYRKLFLNNIKPHTFIAMHIFKELWIKEGYPEVEDFVKLDIESLAKHPKWSKFNKYVKDTNNKNNRYYIGKKSAHANAYREMPNTFILDVLKESGGKVVLSKKQGEIFREMHMLLFPEIHFNWHPAIDRAVKETRTLRNLFGHPRYFGGPLNDALYRKATAFRPQSTVGVISIMAFTELQTLFEENPSYFKGWDMLNQKHDSILLQVPIGAEKEASELSQKHMAKEFVNDVGEKFQMKSEVKVGFNWCDYDEKDNPRGMKEL